MSGSFESALLTATPLPGGDGSVDPALGLFLKARSKTWFVEGRRHAGTTAMLDLVSVEDDSQGETLSLTLSPEIGAEIVDPQDWSPLLRTSFEGPERLGAYLRATQWRTASAADRKLFQAPFRAGIRLDAYQLLPLAKAMELPRVNLLIADDVGKSANEGRFNPSLSRPTSPGSQRGPLKGPL